MTILFPIIYSAALTYLVWKAFKVMSNGWNISGSEKKPFNNSKFHFPTMPVDDFPMMDNKDMNYIKEVFTKLSDQYQK